MHKIIFLLMVILGLEFMEQGPVWASAANAPEKRKAEDQGAYDPKLRTKPDKLSWEMYDFICTYNTGIKAQEYARAAKNDVLRALSKDAHLSATVTKEQISKLFVPAIAKQEGLRAKRKAKKMEFVTPKWVTPGTKEAALVEYLKGLGNHSGIRIEQVVPIKKKIANQIKQHEIRTEQEVQMAFEEMLGKGRERYKKRAQDQAMSSEMLLSGDWATPTQKPLVDLVVSYQVPPSVTIGAQYVEHAKKAVLRLIEEGTLTDREGVEEAIEAAITEYSKKYVEHHPVKNKLPRHSHSLSAARESESGSSEGSSDEEFDE